jgi:hypothetical protein
LFSGRFTERTCGPECVENRERFEVVARRQPRLGRHRWEVDGPRYRWRIQRRGEGTSRSRRECRPEGRPDPSHVGETAFDEEDDVDQVLGPRVELAGPREGVRVDLLGELLGLRDRQHFRGRDAGERQELVPEDPLGFADERIPLSDVYLELRVGLPDEDRLARIARPAPRGVGELLLRCTDAVGEIVAEVDVDRLLDPPVEAPGSLRARSRCGCAKTTGTSGEILRVEEGPWNFVWFPGVEPTNNAAEPALRHAVIWPRISGGTDAESGSRFMERVLTVAATCRLRGRDVLECLTSCFEADLDGQVIRPLLAATGPAIRIA